MVKCKPLSLDRGSLSVIRNEKLLYLKRFKPMHELIYCSMATGEMLEADILGLLKVAVIRMLVWR
jgi:hypothetical protein